ncbi:hypothetical protein BDV95DRAFT_320758 [Massariosphaeria phaeospora]|uniref:DUF1770-domain-containing protein n=1 Tax=Massariosphaeria phaeospora TaxID=100035 RepID=A0A7C8MB56_9PLEO|nr:hypothetical protein BDV95DRAFT_320758 [Massariosphaeria phaeospora]
MSFSDAPLEIASTIQSAHINWNPSPRHDLNPSTAASEKQPVDLDSHPDPDDLSDVAEDEIPISVLNPAPRRSAMPPLPDLRFEQSYLKSIEKAQGWPAVLWITFQDQVLMAFAQGVVYALLQHGWKHMNQSASFSGAGVGARIRRWWWGVNNWKLPGGGIRSDKKLARNVTQVSTAFLNH